MITNFRIIQLPLGWVVLTNLVHVDPVDLSLLRMLKIRALKWKVEGSLVNRGAVKREDGFSIEDQGSRAIAVVDASRDSSAL